MLDSQFQCTNEQCCTVYGWAASLTLFTIAIQNSFKFVVWTAFYIQLNGIHKITWLNCVEAKQIIFVVATIKKQLNRLKCIVRVSRSIEMLINSSTKNWVTAIAYCWAIPGCSCGFVSAHTWQSSRFVRCVFFLFTFCRNLNWLNVKRVNALAAFVSLQIIEIYIFFYWEQPLFFKQLF